MPSPASPEALLALLDLIESFSRATRDRGHEYYWRKRVLNIAQPQQDVVGGTVRGGRDYTTVLRWDRRRRRWFSGCNCPVQTNCKHAFALARAWIDRCEPNSQEEAMAVPAPTQEAVFIESWGPKAEAHLGRKLHPFERTQLESIALLFQTMEAMGRHPPPVQLCRRFGFNPSRAAQNGFEAFPGWWNEATAPRNPVELWQYFAIDLENAGEKIPEVFQVFTDTAETRRKVRRIRIEEEVDNWKRGEFRPGLQQSLPGQPADLRLRILQGGARLEAIQPGSDKWRAPQRQWLNALPDATPSHLASLSAPARALALSLTMDRRRRWSGGALGERLDATALEHVLSFPGAVDAIVLPDGTPWQFPEASLTWRARLIDAPDGHRLEFFLETPEGKPAEAAEQLISRPEILYLFEDRLYRGHPRPPATSISLEALDHPTVLQGIRRREVALPEEVARNILTVRLKPRIACSLEEVGINSVLRLRLFAESESPHCRAHFVPGEWEWLEVTETPEAHRLDLDCDEPDAVRGALLDFARWDERARSWRREVGRQFPEDFIEWRASLPASVRVDASPDLAGILGGPLKGTVNFAALPAERSGQDWFDLFVELKVPETDLTAEEIALLLKAKGRWLRLPRRGWQRLELDAQGADAAALDRLGIVADDLLKSGKPTKHRMHALQLAPEIAHFEQSDSALAQRLKDRAVRLRDMPPPTVPAHLENVLRPYQAEGFRFLVHLSDHGLGGVLADDMGLGKTVQTLTWLLHLLGRQKPVGGPFRALVVCPKSVTHGWEQETVRFAPGLRPLMLASADIAAGTPSLPANQPAVIIVNYTTLRLHAQWFASQNWQAIVLDEAQFVKNPTSEVAKAARALNAPHRLALTGTPVENRLTDLWSILSFAQPGVLGTQAAFRKQYPEKDPLALPRLRRRVRHFMLRRTKGQVATDLPPRTEDEIRVDLEPAQRRLYDAELKRARRQLLGIETDAALDSVRFNVLASLLRLRQICCHPALIDPAHANLPSAKLDALQERLEELHEEGQQVLVFSQFVQMLELIGRRLEAAGIPFLQLTGKTENRAALVEQFQRDQSKTVFLLSLKAAGFGLNLTAASYAILFDPWWNPAVEAQAIDRTHRIGQTNPVVAYRLIARGTVEEKIRALQQEKAQLAGEIVQEESLASVLDLDSLRQILS